GRLEMVAGEDAEAAGVDRQALVEPVLGGEIRDEEIVRQLAFLPPRSTLLLDRKTLLHTTEVHRVLRRQRPRQVVVGELREQRCRVVPKRAEAVRREVREERACTWCPAEREVARNLGERLAQRRSV